MGRDGVRTVKWGHGLHDLQLAIYVAAVVSSNQNSVSDSWVSENTPPLSKKSRMG
jgi:hypothetical protein